jgi:hypothetical protein
MKRVLRKGTPVELIAAAYANEGLRPVEGENRARFLNSRYDVSVDTERNQYVARRKTA